MPDLSSREALVDRARDAWIRRLIDLSRRNNLLYYRELKTGTLDLTPAWRPGPPDGGRDVLGGPPEGRHLAELFRAGGDAVPLSRLVAGATDEEVGRATARLKEIRARALANLEEKGLATLFLAVGMASWKPDDEGRPPRAPVALMPLAVESRGRDARALALRRAGDLQINLVLVHVLAVQHGIDLDAEALADLIQGDDEGETFDLAPLFTRLAAAARGVPDFAIWPALVVSNFSFQKMAMVRDLQESGAGMAAHDIIAGVAGDGGARAAARNRLAIDPRELDRVPPDDEFLIMDADSSQQRVIAAAAAGESGVISGPPGTGKSQTISNMVASLAAAGRRVLFVAEKRAALDVVKRRLDDRGLGHLCLDLHGADISRRQIMRQVAESLEAVRDASAVDADTLHRRFVDRRARLNAHADRLHRPEPPSGLTVFDLQGRLLQAPEEARSTTRWRGRELSELRPEQVDATADLLIEAAGFERLFLRDDPSPWTGAALPDGAAATDAMERAARLAGDRWPRLAAAIGALGEATGLAPPATIGDAETAIGLAARAGELLRVYDPALFDLDLRAAVAKLQRARGWLPRWWASVFDGDFKRVAAAFRACRHAGPAGTRRLLDEGERALKLSEAWRARAASGARPALAPDLDAARALLESFVDDAVALMGWLKPATRAADGAPPADRRSDARTLAVADLQTWLGALAADTATPPRLPRLFEIERDLEAHGAGALVSELRAVKPPAEAWPARLRHAWWASCLDQVRAADPALAGFNGRTHDRYVEEFNQLDRERLKVAIARVRRAHAERAIAVRNAHPDQDALVVREAAKKTRHQPLRRLLAEAPDVLTALRPCWMASPLSVSQLLPSDRQYFDVVVFDEASQVLPEDAVPALLRAPHAIVAGDDRQLPPTTFFAADEDEDGGDDAGAAEGFESILDLMSSFLDPPWSLDWHYRSRDEALIAFSNHHIYGGRLVTFPGPGGEPVVSHVLVPPAPGSDDQDDSVTPEVDAVVALVLTHAAERPDETLGVIAMGIPHARRVEAAIESARAGRPELDAFFDQSKSDRFFVKNLERVQGDERDAIVLTIGYGKDRSGRLPYRFGPLLMAGGERRLNVAVTRARRRLTLVSSFAHTDMDPSRSTARGVELLRAYLEYAAGGGRRLDGDDAGRLPLEPFEQAVAVALAARGLALVPRCGTSRARIDLVARHPSAPESRALAVECDGPAYRAAPTARDRDRLRRQQLEALGWRYHRIWSTDWFQSPAEELARAVAACDERASHAGAGAGPAASPVTAGSEVSAAGWSADAGRLRKPRLRDGGSIDDYTDDELEKLVRWLLSRRLMTDEELVDTATAELGFHRRGRRIEDALRRAVAAVRARPPADV